MILHLWNNKYFYSRPWNLVMKSKNVPFWKEIWDFWHPCLNFFFLLDIFILTTSPVSLIILSKKYLHAHLYCQFCCLKKTRAISGNCQYSMNEPRTNSFFAKKIEFALRRQVPQTLVQLQCLQPDRITQKVGGLGYV